MDNPAMHPLDHKVAELDALAPAGETALMRLERLFSAMLLEGLSCACQGSSLKQAASIFAWIIREAEAARYYVAPQVMRAMNRLAFIRHQEQSHDAAVATQLEAIIRFGAHPASHLRAELADEAVFLAGALSIQRQHAAALRLLEAVETTFGEDRDPTVQELACYARFQQPRLLAELGRVEETAAAIGHLSTRYGEGTPRRKALVQALLDDGLDLVARWEHPTALSLFRPLLQRCSDALTSGARDKLARALLYIGEQLSGADDRRSAPLTLPDLRDALEPLSPAPALTPRQVIGLGAYCELYRHFRDAAAPSLRALAWEGGTRRLDLLQRGGQVEEASILLQEMLCHPRETLPAEACPALAEAHVSLAEGFQELGRPDRAIDALRQVLSRWRDLPDGRVQQAVASGGVLLAQILVEQRQFDEARAVIATLLDRHAAATNPHIQRDIMMARVTLGRCYLESRALRSALEVLEPLIREFRGTSDAILAAQWLLALETCAEAHLRQRRFQPALERADELVSHLEQSRSLRPLMLHALHRKMTCHFRLEQDEQAVRTARRLLNLNGDSHHTHDDALFMVGYVTILDAKRVWKRHGREAGQEALRQARRRFRDDPHFDAGHPCWRAHLAYIASLLGEVATAWSEVHAAIALRPDGFRERLRQVYSERVVLLEDRDFQALLEPLA